MRRLILAAALPPVLLLAAAGAAAASCPFHEQASRAAATLVADNSPTSTPAPASGTVKQPDSVAFPNSPNGSPAAGDKGAPVVTDKAACSGTGAVKCSDSPPASSKADTGDVKIATPTTVDGSAPK